MQRRLACEPDAGRSIGYWRQLYHMCYSFATVEPRMDSALPMSGQSLVLSPQEALVAGGPAEELEQRIQDLFRRGYAHVVVDLRAAPAADSAGLRALVRGHTSAQRLNRRFTLVGPNAGVRELLRFAQLDRVLEVKSSLDEAHVNAVQWDRILTIVGVIVVGIALVGVGLLWPGIGVDRSSAGSVAPFAEPAPAGFAHPLFELAKLMAAAIIGMLVTVVHRRYRSERGPNPTMDQAQVLLCVSGALMMIIIGNSLARAFGIAGAASIIRFRTPVEDPKDVTILFLLMGLGMSTGLGAFAVAGLGTAFLCLTLVALDMMAKQQTRLMSIEIVAGGRVFPSTRVEEVFARNQIVFEPREIAQADEVTVKYHAWLDPRMSLDDVSAQLMRDVSGLMSVSWEHPKRV
jgi:anti-anti-sigma factor